MSGDLTVNIGAHRFILLHSISTMHAAMWHRVVSSDGSLTIRTIHSHQQYAREMILHVTR
jgi:alkylated DNA nucleotide flippase Atl1